MAFPFYKHHYYKISSVTLSIYVFKVHIRTEQYVTVCKKYYRKFSLQLLVWLKCVGTTTNILIYNLNILCITLNLKTNFVITFHRLRIKTYFLTSLGSLPPLPNKYICVIKSSVIGVSNKRTSREIFHFQD